MKAYVAACVMISDDLFKTNFLLSFTSYLDFLR